MRTVYSWLVIQSLVIPYQLSQAEEAAIVDVDSGTATAVAERLPPLDPFFLLVQADAVRNELGLSDEQQNELDKVLREHNRLLLSIRDSGPQLVPVEKQPDLKQARKAVYQVLVIAQRRRLQSLILQAQGYGALFHHQIVSALKIDEQQLEDLNAIDEEFRQTVERASSSSTRDEAASAIEAAQQTRHRRVLEILDERQMKLWSRLLGDPFDFSQLKRSPAWAPEFEEVETWINSPPLTMESLQGQVVVVHFFAFGCVNCIHNYPWYNEWYEEYKDREVTIIGIHTPETQREHDVEQLRESLAKHGLQFPVAVDNEQKNWRAWSNGVWPSVYVIDKRGRLRDWWYGELDWEGAGGQVLTRKLIDELLAEE